MKALKRSLVIIVLLGLSVGIGFSFQFVVTLYEKTTHPLKYSEFVEKYSSLYGVPREIVYSVIKAESSFRPDAVSSAGAVGLMQITPDTFDTIQRSLGEKLDNAMLNDPETNIKYGTYYLYMLFNSFHEWDMAFAAYNAGPSRLRAWIDSGEYSVDKNGVAWVPYPETRKHIAKIEANMKIYKKLYFEN